MSTAAEFTTTDEQIERANATGLNPVVFIHGLWLLPSSWDRWAAVFEEAGYTALTPGWPDDPETVEEANAHPEVFAGKSVGDVADHYGEVIGKLEKTPIVVVCRGYLNGLSRRRSRVRVPSLPSLKPAL